MPNVNEIKWNSIKPEVNEEAEFFEIVNDFGNPLEILREAISNSIDASATFLKIGFDVKEIEGKKRLVITLSDNGEGMNSDIIKKDFWGLGYSRSRGRPEAIGEKGHGTKIYLRSEKVEVKTHHKDRAYVSVCENPLAALSKKNLHQPKWRSIVPEQKKTGTEIVIIGYNDNQRSFFKQSIVKDYILWYTKLGSIEKEFDIKDFENFKVHLKCLDKNEYEEISFGHVFPTQNSNIEKLFAKNGSSAADLYVKKFSWKNEHLNEHPEVVYNAIISVEGDEIKRIYNPMIQDRSRKETGKYRVADRYGIWLCKDYIPIMRVNEWITGFGSGSNAFVLLHGFVNCQDLKLTANRGSIANTDPKILEELKVEIKKKIDEIDEELHGNGVYTLRGWQQEERTIKQEGDEFKRRIKNIKKRNASIFNKRIYLEPSNESELFGLFIAIYSKYNKYFNFEIVDYNTSTGIDIIIRNVGGKIISDGEFAYLELKYLLNPRRFNHSFKNLQWIVCWDFDKSMVEGTEFVGIEENDTRELKIVDEGGELTYFLDSPRRSRKIQIIRLKEFLKEKLNIEFNKQFSDVFPD